MQGSCGGRFADGELAFVRCAVRGPEEVGHHSLSEATVAACDDEGSLFGGHVLGIKIFTKATFQGREFE